MNLGAPTKYDKKYDEQVFKLCLLGATDKEIADFFEVTETTINNWKIQFPTFFESIKAGKSKADATVAQSLYKRANGYEHPEDDIRVCDKGIVITPTIKHYPPDSTAAIFWLKNRQPAKWRDKQEVEHSGKLEPPSTLQIEIVNASEKRKIPPSSDS